MDLAINVEAEREQARDELRQIKASYHALQVRLQRVQISVTSGGASATNIPDSLGEIEDWAIEHLSGEVEMHQRALRAARISDFIDVPFVYQALMMMRDYYVPMRRDGGAEIKEAFNQKCSELGLENTKCFAQNGKAKKFGDTYFVRYQGIKHELDWHLKGSASREGRHGFRMYYFWDKDNSCVVVGYLPGHLKNDHT